MTDLFESCDMYIPAATIGLPCAAAPDTSGKTRTPSRVLYYYHGVYTTIYLHESLYHQQLLHETKL